MENKEKLDMLISEANKGRPIYQLMLGHAYFEGTITPVNYVEAVRWYQKAADNNNMMAEYYLACCIFRGIGTAKDEKKGIKKLKKLADRDCVPAMVELGCLLFNDHYQVKAKPKLGKEYLRMAMDKGDIEAIHYYIDYLIEEEAFEEADMYLERLIELEEIIADYVYLYIGVHFIEQDNKAKYNRGIQRLIQAAEVGNDEAKVILYKTHYFKTKINIPEEKLEEYIYDAFLNGHPDAVPLVLENNINDINNNLGTSEVLKQLESSAENGSALSALILGNEHLRIGDIEAGEYWLKIAVSNGGIDSAYLLGSLILYKKNELGIEVGQKDLDEAIGLLEFAHSNDLVEATIQLLNYYQSKDGFNSQKRDYYLNSLKRHKDQAAYINLATYYYNNDNYKESIKWLKKVEDIPNKTGAINMAIAELYRQMGELNWYYQYLFLSAEQGFLDALIIAGETLMDIENSYRDYYRAKEYLTQALPHKHAYFLLGILYTEGLGVSRDYNLAVEYFNEAKKQGHESAIQALEQFEKNKFGNWVIRY